MMEKWEIVKNWQISEVLYRKIIALRCGCMLEEYILVLPQILAKSPNSSLGQAACLY